jgi:DNA-binding NtrC family response regulator
LPALRERRDRLELARALLAQLALPRRGSAFDVVPTFAASGEAWIAEHDWPGNVRELKSAIAHALAMAHDPTSSSSVRQVTLAREHFPEPLFRRSPESVDSSEAAESPTRRKAMRDLADAALARAGGNVSEAARRLGVARSTLYRLLTSTSSPAPSSKRRS